MTVFLIVLLILALIIFALLMLQGSIVIEYKDEVRLGVKVLFVTVPIVPKKQKKINLRKFSYKNYQKLLAKDAAKAEKKAANKAARDAKKAPAEGTATKSASPDIMGNLGEITALVKTVLGCFYSHLRIDVCRLIITVGGKDASSTALTYGLVSQGVAYLMETLANTAHFKRKKNEHVEVNADFLSDKITADVKLIFRVRVVHILHILWKALLGYLPLKEKLDNSAKAKAKASE